jgi:hypothetical protein
VKTFGRSLCVVAEGHVENSSEIPSEKAVVVAVAFSLTLDVLIPAACEEIFLTEIYAYGVGLVPYSTWRTLLSRRNGMIVVSRA